MPSLLLQAAAHGLPMVATKNGGPVDIHKVQHQFHNLNFDLCCFRLQPRTVEHPQTSMSTGIIKRLDVLA